MRVTIKKIVQAVRQSTGLDVGMEKYEGVYYWCGKTACVLAYETENCTHMVRLNDWTLERWIEDFTHRVDEFNRNNERTVQQEIDHINWVEL